MKNKNTKTQSRLAKLAFIPLIITAVLFSSSPFQSNTVSADETNPQAVDAVNTNTATAITQGLANFNGDITDSGSTITRRGFEWGFDTSYGNDLGAPGTFSIGPYAYQVSGLNCGTTYQYRAYFVNSSGTFYGNSQSFSTSACTDPIVTTGNAGGNGKLLEGSVLTQTPNLTSTGTQWGTTDNFGNTVIAPPSTFPFAGAYSGQFGSYGAGPGQLSSPWGIAIDQSQNIYVSNYSNGTINKYSNSGVFIKRFGSFGVGYGNIKYPAGMAISPDNKLYVADSGNNKIAIFDTEGVFQNEFGTVGSGNDQFISPLALTFDASGNIYVADSGNSRIEVFYPSLNYKSEFGSEGDQPDQLNFPTDIKINSLGNLIIGDYVNNRIQIFSTTGIPISRFGSYGDGLGQFSGYLSIAIDSQDNIFVSDYDNDWVQKFSPTGSNPSYFGGNGSGDGQFSSPINLIIDSSNNILVNDLGNGRVQKFINTKAYPGTYFYSLNNNFSACTNYFYRSFASNPFGTFYGDTKTFTSSGCPFTPEQIEAFLGKQKVNEAPPAAENTTSNPPTTINQNNYTQPESKPGGILGVLASLLKSVPPNVAESIPYLLISLLLLLALLYAIQSYREYIAVTKFKKLKEQSINLQDANKNFITLTNHYLNTPISILQLSSEALLTSEVITNEQFNISSEAIKSIKDKISQLLKSNEETNIQDTYTLNPDLKISSMKLFSSSSFKAWGAILLAGMLLLLANYLLIKAGSFQISANSLVVQAALFVLVSIFLIFTYQNSRKNRRNKQKQSDLLKANQMLMDKKMNFINSTANNIRTEISKLREISSSLEENEKTKPFLKGIYMLGSIEKSFELLQKFSVVAPTDRIGQEEMSEILTEINKRQNSMIKEKGLRVTMNIPQKLNLGLTKSALILLLGSTINNAIKFSKNGGAITISAKSLRNHTLVKITDNGIGIDKNKIDYLMQPFSRATDVMQYDYEGMGLGLYLDRVIMEQIGGDIKINSSLGVGTTVELKIPKAKNSSNKKLSKEAKLNRLAIAQ